MRLHSTLFLFIFIWASFLNAQPNTEIYLFDLIKDGNQYRVANPINVSNQNPGYDNQPHFTADGNLLYTGTVNGNTEVILYDLSTSKSKNLSQSLANEYSPTPIPNGMGFSCIYDTTQNLVQYSYKNHEDTTILIDNAVVGYHAWLNHQNLVLFALGSPNTLQLYHLPTKTATVVDSTIGRSLHKIPSTSNFSYVDKKVVPFMVTTRDFDGNNSTAIIALPEGVEDIIWSPNAELFSSNGSSLIMADMSAQNWVKIADLSDYGLSGITRLSINPNGDKIAIVVNE